MTELHAFYHCYADGEWKLPTEDYLRALLDHGMYEQLTSLNIGFMGCRDNVERVETYLRSMPITYNVVAISPDLWEQATLIPLWEWCQSHDGYVSYAHSKGAGFNKEISLPWRRSMLYYNIVRWQTAVQALDGGKKIAGCHWLNAEPSITNKEWGYSGMFGGNFWWAKADLLRQNVRPTLRSRLDAEHWIGQLSEVMDLSSSYIEDFNGREIANPQSHVTPDWLAP